MAAIGAFTFVLHSHLPYARLAGRWPHGEEWIHEAASETYIPLLQTLYDLKDEGIHYKLTVGITPILAEHLSRASGWDCREGKDGEAVTPNRIYLAPGNYHMVVEVEGGRKIIRLNQNPPENFCRPSVDPMLRSLAKAYGSRLLVMMLTGMGKDGQAGAEVAVQAGGTVAAQDEETSVVWGMPGAVATAGLCSAVLPLDRLSAYLYERALRNAA